MAARRAAVRRMARNAEWNSVRGPSGVRATPRLESTATGVSTISPIVIAHGSVRAEPSAPIGNPETAAPADGTSAGATAGSGD